MAGMASPLEQCGEPQVRGRVETTRARLKKLVTAGVHKVRLYDAPHACLSWMADNGVPNTVVSAWAGHSDLEFTKRVSGPGEPASGSDKLSELLS